MATFIDPTSSISKKVQIGVDVHIGPFNVIDGPVKIGDGCKIGPFNNIKGEVEIGSQCHLYQNVSIKGKTVIGKGCKFWQFSSIGDDPQDLKFKDEKSELYIGDKGMFREFVSISRGTRAGGGKTVIGKNCFILNGGHVGHDCILGDNVNIISQTLIGGCCTIGNHVTLSPLSFITPNTRIGDYAMTSAYSYLRMDASPFSIVVGNENPKVWKVNTVRLQRCNFKEEDINIAKKIFNLYFRKKLTSQDALEKINQEFSQHILGKIFVDFVKNSKKGVLR